MTQISQIIEAWKALVEGQIEGITEIPNPYEPEKNPDLLLQNGYGIGVGPAENTNRRIGGHVSMAREFEIMLFRLVGVTENDATGIRAAEKSILEDQIKLIKQVEQDPTLGSSCANAQFVNSDPVEYLIADQSGRRYFRLFTIFRCEYFEDVRA